MKIGIYLGYRPNTQFNNQGLGRFLANLTGGLLKEQADEITILCPSWLRSDIQKHLASSGNSSIRILAPSTVPPVVLLYERVFRKVSPKKSSKLKTVIRHFQSGLRQVADTIFTFVLHVLSTRWLPAFIAASLCLAVVLLVLSPIIILFAPIALFFGLTPLARVRPALYQKLGRYLRVAKKMLPSASVSFNGKPRMSLRWAIYDFVQDSEVKEMLALAEQDQSVDIWYVPTVFWPEASALKPKVVQCFPDMLLSEFPTKFTLDGVSALPVYERAKQAIQNGQHFITYSRATANRSLIRPFAIDPAKVFAVPHAAMDLSSHLAIQGTLDDAYAKQRLSTTILEEHRNVKWNNDRYLNNFSFEDVSYVFFASQFRPNKNLMNLVYAYETVLRKDHRYTKMILTGDARDASEFNNYIFEKRLQYDIIFAHDVSDRVLAALYHRASLVVNPTFYEGGFPFTFSEGMSVGTPSVMSRIPQTEEVITGDLAKVMLFDPLSPEDMADRIVFGLDNREQLLRLQTPLYEALKQRTWQHVARDHIDVFAKILQENDSR